MAINQFAHKIDIGRLIIVPIFGLFMIGNMIAVYGDVKAMESVSAINAMLMNRLLLICFYALLVFLSKAPDNGADSKNCSFRQDHESKNQAAAMPDLSLSRKEVKNMKNILRYMRMKLQEEKGEVSVEWALVAVIMAGVILAVFLPGVRGALSAAIDSIKAALTTGAAG